MQSLIEYPSATGFELSPAPKAHKYGASFLASSSGERGLLLSLRNAAAHNDCLLNSLNVRQKSSSRTGVVKILEQNYSIDAACFNPVKRVPLAVDFSALLVAYDVVVPCGQSRTKARDGLIRMRSRFFENIQIFQNEAEVVKAVALREFLSYLDNLLEVFIERLGKEPIKLEQGTPEKPTR